MATIFELIAGFFTGKTYRAKDFARSHKALITSGVLADDLETFQVVPSAGMTVAVKPGSGYCWIEGHYGELEATAALTLTTADGVLNRIDRIVARLDTANAKITLTVLTGTTAVTPAAPAITRDGTVYDLCLASIYVAKGTTTVTTAMITDTRADSSLCGGCLVRTADLLALAGKADKTYVDGTFATKAPVDNIISGATQTNANKLQGEPVTLSSPTNRQILQYNGTGFVNRASFTKTLLFNGSGNLQIMQIPLATASGYDFLIISVRLPGNYNYTNFFTIPVPTNGTSYYIVLTYFYGVDSTLRGNILRVYAQNDILYIEPLFIAEILLQIYGMKVGG